MSARKNNKLAQKWKDGKQRRELCVAFMKHVEKGYSIDCFPDCDFKTIKKYMKDYPQEFQSDQISRSQRLGRMFWEQIGLSGTVGKIKGFNAKSWDLNMKNRYGWKEKQDITSGDKPLKTQIIKIGDKEIEF